jgi:hypothetical protein
MQIALLVLHTKEEMALQGMVERLIEIGSFCGMEINVDETKVVKVLRQPSHAQIMIDQVQPGGVEYCSYLGVMVTKTVICTREFTFRIAVAKAAVNNKKNVFTDSLEVNLRKKLEKCYIWSIAFHGAENWTLRNVDQKYLGSF